VWAEVTSTNNSLRNEIDFEFRILVSNLEDYTTGYDGSTHGRSEDLDDHCRIVPLDEIPDEIIAEIARLRILGELQ
jgi:hypothetical protein